MCSSIALEWRTSHASLGCRCAALFLPLSARANLQTRADTAQASPESVLHSSLPLVVVRPAVLMQAACLLLFRDP